LCGCVPLCPLFGFAMAVSRFLTRREYRVVPLAL
jgi:hypothetical protein